MTILYLIFHKVRGQPAFDIAQRACAGPRPCQPTCGCWDGQRCLMEDEWIIPTSGHAAYPVWWCELSDLEVTERMIQTSGLIPPFTIEDDWPDHYPIRKSADPAPTAQPYLTALGLTERPIHRRRVSP